MHLSLTVALQRDRMRMVATSAESVAQVVAGPGVGTWPEVPEALPTEPNVKVMAPGFKWGEEGPDAEAADR